MWADYTDVIFCDFVGFLQEPGAVVKELCECVGGRDRDTLIDSGDILSYMGNLMHKVQ